MKFLFLILLAYIPSSFSYNFENHPYDSQMSQLTISLLDEVESNQPIDSFLYTKFKELENRHQRILFFNYINSEYKSGIVRGHIDHVIASADFSKRQLDYIKVLKSNLTYIYKLDSTEPENIARVEELMFEAKILFNEKELKSLFYGIVNY